MNVKARIKEALREHIIYNDVLVDAASIDINELNLQILEELEAEAKSVKNGMVLTAGELKKRLQEVPDNAIVYTERVEDVYFEKYGWKTKKFNQDTLNGSEFIRSFDVSYDKRRNKVLIYNHY